MSAGRAVAASARNANLWTTERDSDRVLVTDPGTTESAETDRRARGEPHDPAVAAAAGGSSHRVKRKSVKSAPRQAKTRAAHDADTVTASMLPREIQIGDRFTDHDFEWEVVTQPAALHGGKSLRARIRRPELPETERDMTWPAHERVDIRRGPRVTE